MAPNFTFIPHGRQRQRTRLLTSEIIYETINNPAFTMPGNKPGEQRVKHIGHPDSEGKVPCVVTSWPPDETDTVEVVTCYYKGN